jgi:nitrite reductase (NAD(P)H)
VLIFCCFSFLSLFPFFHLQGEWTRVVNEPSRRKTFEQFANAPSTSKRSVQQITERSQPRPAAWPKDFPAVRLSKQDIAVPVSEWSWVKVCETSDLMPSTEGATSATILHGDTQIAVFDVPGRGFFATQNMCPHKRAQLLSHGIVGDDADGNVVSL